jgi:transcriptional regulator with XRE-family HTH domain
MILLPGSVQKQIGTRVRLLRLAEGWTQADLARRTGVSKGTIERLEREANVTLPRLLRVAAALGVLDSFTRLFPAPEPRSIEEMIQPKRVRARRKRRNAHS